LSARTSAAGLAGAPPFIVDWDKSSRSIARRIVALCVGAGY